MPTSTALVTIALIVTWAGILFSKYRNQKGAAVPNEDMERKIRDEFSKKINILEQRIVELKGENHMLRGASTDSGARIAEPNQKLSILSQQRVFLHELASKIQVLQGAADGALAVAKTMDHKDNELLMKRLTMISRNLEEMAKLHAANREFIIIAA